MYAWRELKSLMNANGLDVDFAFLIGFAIRNAREEAGMTQERLAAMIDCSGSAISRFESGMEIARAETINKILRATATSVSATDRAPIAAPASLPERHRTT